MSSIHHLETSDDITRMKSVLDELTQNIEDNNEGV
jgi:hypothetical protein